MFWAPTRSIALSGTVVEARRGRKIHPKTSKSTLVTSSCMTNYKGALLGFNRFSKTSWTKMDHMTRSSDLQKWTNIVFCYVHFKFSYRSNFFVSRNYELRFSKNLYRYLIRSFPGSFFLPEHARDNSGANFRNKQKRLNFGLFFKHTFKVGGGYPS